MIIVDTSVLVAILRHEAEEGRFIDILDDSPATIMSAVSYVETHMVFIGRRVLDRPTSISALVGALGIEIAEVTREQSDLAIAAFLAYGKGRHEARLNLADCFAYALARSRGAPLLFKGNDFSKIDIAVAWRP